MSTSSLVVFLSCILLISLLRLNTAQMCYNTGNFTTNSTYAKNRDLALSSLASNVTANGGYYAATLGQGSDTVYAVGICRGDISGESCFNCINTFSQATIKNCPNQKEAINWGNPALCTIRCSYKSFFGVMDTRPAIYVWIQIDITNNVDEFDQALNRLVENLVFRAATARGYSPSNSSGHKFVTGKGNFTEYENIYALMQCTPDLSSSDCSDCLRGAVDDYRSCCKRKRAVNVLRPSCIFQYDLYQFYESTADASPPPPPPLAVTFAPPPSTPSTNTTTKEDNKSGSFQTAIIIVVPMSFLLLLIILGFAFYRLWKHEDVQKRLNSGGTSKMTWIAAASKLFRVSRQSDLHQADEDASQGVDSLQFDFATIRAATNEFSNANKLGQGGYGWVYKGKLSNGQEIAVKRLTNCFEQGEVQFKNEIVLMARLHHKNLVTLLGFCLEGKERLLIYEFVPNASLDRFIFDPMKRMLLNWDTRYNIILGIARGLVYLHEESQFRIIHHDLKSGNILLDSAMNPKIADFGMARLFGADQSRGISKRIGGTYGYMPPEYAKYGQFSVKTDVFGFGVLILEIVSGKKNGSTSADQIEHLLSYAWKKWREGKALSLIDQTLSSGSKSDKMRCIHIGLLCVQENVAKRPTMASIVLMLTSFSMSLPLPSKPGFLMQSSTNSHMSLPGQFPSLATRSNQSPNNYVNLSINEASITELSPR